MKRILLQMMLMCSLPAVLFAANVNSPYEQYACEGGYFSAMVPVDWSRSERGHPYGDLTKVYGVKLSGPKDRDGAAATISLLYYSGEKFFTDHRQYIKSRLDSMVRVDRGAEEDLAAVEIGGLAGTAFSIKTFELVYQPSSLRNIPPPPDDGSRIYEYAPPSKKVIMVEHFIVLPAGKGFSVLHYRAPIDTVGDYQKVFEDVTASFRPQVK